MKTVTVSAPGKLLLLGDHAVVYGHPCLVTAIDRRVSLSAHLIDRPMLCLNASAVGLMGYEKPLSRLTTGKIPKVAEYIEYAVAAFIKRYPQKTGVRIETTAESMDVKFGFGSSAAVTVAVVKALAVLFGQSLDNRGVFELAYQAVLALKGVGSGCDVAAATYGGFLYYVTGPAMTIQPLTVALPCNLAVAYSGNKADTPSLVRAMNAQAEQYPEIIHGLFDVSEQIVKRGLQDLEASNMDSLGKLFSMHQGLLAALSASTAELDAICQVATQAGAYGAKLSGAGGGDCAIALVGVSKTEAVVQALNQAGFETLVLKTGSPGVRIKSQT